MTLRQIVNRVSNKEHFQTIEDYIEFCRIFLNCAATDLQATIVSRNEPHYTFWQFKKAGNFNITRPINSNLMYTAKDEGQFSGEFLDVLANIRETSTASSVNRERVNRAIYTLQQSIGAALDALPSGKSNTARKINGDLFERLIRLILIRVGVECSTGVVTVPVKVDGEPAFEMSYQHDLIIKEGELVKVIGSVKTSSKDRLDKIFIDKFLFGKLTGSHVPHVAIFLNDVQRKNTKNPREYGINATFLPGHFKGYTVKLNPLDGVYYCDIRPNMRTEPILRDHIKTFDHFLFGDLWELLDREAITAKIEE